MSIDIRHFSSIMHVINHYLPIWDISNLPLISGLAVRMELTLSRHVYSDRYQIFLEKLRQARLEAGLTQLEVAQRLGKPQSYISKCESGERRVDFIELLEFARLYRKSPDFFIP